MIPGADALAEALRLAGALLLVMALGQVLLEDDRPRPMTVALSGAGLLVIGCIGLLFATVAPIAARTGEPLRVLAWDYLQQTQSGPALLLPLLPAIYALMLFDGIRTARSPGLRKGLAWMLVVALAALVALIGAVGHSATTRWEHLGMFLLAAHVVSAIAWAGLVVSLLPRLLRGAPLATLLRTWGDIAAGLVVALILTGLGAAWLHGTPPPWPLDDAYGRLLSLKFGVLLLALAAAGWNRYVELRRQPIRELHLRCVAGVETGLLLLALLLAAWLSRTPPPV